MRVLGYTLVIFLLMSCGAERKSEKLFDLIPPEESGLHFVNKVENTKAFNIFNYRNFYNGGGVATADINNDGLVDIYLTNNLGDNKLFLNKGNFQFEDITEQAGVLSKKGWSTGVVMVDINHDGWLDIYVCNAGYVKGQNQENELFINNKDLTFTERATEYGLNENGYTTHAAFFDYDLDGDLDCYILNNSFMPVNTLNYSNKRELYAEDWPVKDFLKGGGDKMMRNDKGKFTNVTKEAGIFGSLIGFGLGVTVGDVNGDHLPDMYVSNDFFERDYLYINNGDGTFEEDIKNRMEHISLFSMGADMADINNDGFPEIFVTDMLPDDEYRLKTTTLFENYSIYYLKLQRDFYHQYMHNTLQFNNKDQSFSEIAHFSGVAASDWSWGALMFDADNDGYRDIYVCNGIYNDVTDQDFINFFADEIIQKMALTGKKEEIDKVIARMPSTPILNKAFKNNQDLTFKENGVEWGFEKASFSNGAAYADLDNDGDLDLVINNLNQEAFLYRNNAENLYDHHHLSIQLKGKETNTFAIGSKVSVFKKGDELNFQLIPTRGFQSSVDYKMVFGLGKDEKVDSIVVVWPDKSKTIFNEPPIDTTLVIHQSEASGHERHNPYDFDNLGNTVVQEIEHPFAAHREDDYIDFFQEGLVMRMISREGPKVAVADLNRDGKDDLFIGGGTGQPGQLYFQTANGFRAVENQSFVQDSSYEDTAVCFFDADGDGDLDLFVGTGGNHRPVGSRQMQDRLYINDSNGASGNDDFIRNDRALSVNGFNTSVAVPLDYDEDGDMDLFVGSRSVPNKYGVPPRSFLYENDGSGNFKDVAKKVSPDLQNIGMITDAQLIDLIGDEKKELVVVGEWMSPKVFEIQGGKFQLIETNLDDFSGWWYALEHHDLDGDGDEDLVLGNRGENFYFTGSLEQPAKLWVSDFDLNGTIEKIITRQVGDRDMTVPLKKELTDQIVSLKKQNLKHIEFANKAIQDLFAPDILNQAMVFEGSWFQSAVALNEGAGNFRMIPLPAEAQFSCVCDIYCKDLNNDSIVDLILGGNDRGFMPQFSKLDASFGQVLLGKGNGEFEMMESRESGFFVRGDVKQLVEINVGDDQYILTLINDRKPKMFKLK